MAQPLTTPEAANAAYYLAFEAADMDAMSVLWEHSPEVICTHPGWATLRGWGRVAASFFALFQGGPARQFLITELATVVRGDTAWVSMEENLWGEQAGVAVAALNIFSRDPQGSWKLVGHHGSVIEQSGPHPPQ